ncbi:MAG TPA: 23S rRNA (pseudouridine(1915)-N(3))-methyltransferase RlmH [Thermoanaerobaculia bacterium]|nr:23S rRNA (pseudouridine(1915)-N(3))-methyltransferase RlmH [Thermoanaerobaculia bacterium]
MRELLIVWSGRRRRDPWEALCADYRQRIQRFLPLRDVTLKPAAGDPQQRLRRDSEAVLQALPQPCRLVALDRRGQALSSQALARRVATERQEWPHAVAYVVGSDIGLDRDLLARAHLRLSLGPLTLPHQLARLVLYEQLYRALSLEAGMQYHRQPL